LYEGSLVEYAAEDDGFLRAINIRSTTSFGVKVKVTVNCMLNKDTCRYGRDTLLAKFADISHNVSTAPLLPDLLIIARELRWMNQE
jgi:hypothetical protein